MTTPPSPAPARVLVVDVETTGLDATRDALIEVAAVLLVGRVEVGAVASRVAPGRAIPAAITQLTGLRDDDVRDAPDARAVLRLLQPWWELADLVVAYNAPFDRGFIDAACRQHGVALAHRPWVDALEVARTAHPEWPGFRLVDVAARMGIAIPHAHRALDDARAAASIYARLALPAPPLTEGATPTDGLGQDDSSDDARTSRGSLALFR